MIRLFGDSHALCTVNGMHHSKTQNKALEWIGAPGERTLPAIAVFGRVISLDGWQSYLSGTLHNLSLPEG